METTLSTVDKKIIHDLVKAYAPGERVRHVRSIFGSSTTEQHFIYLGFVIGSMVPDNTREIHRMKILTFLN